VIQEPRHRPAAVRKRKESQPAEKTEALVSSNLKEALDEQVQANKARRDQLKQREQRLELANLETLERNDAAQQMRNRMQTIREREILAEGWREQAKIKDIKRVIDAIERGKRIPGERSTISAPLGCGIVPVEPEGVHMRAPPPAQEPPALGGIAAVTMSSTCSSAQGTATPRRQAAPLSARGASLGAAASLALSQPLAVEVA